MKHGSGRSLRPYAAWTTHMDVRSAAICMEQLRRRIRAPRDGVTACRKDHPAPMLVVIQAKQLTNNINQLNIKNQR